MRRMRRIPVICLLLLFSPAAAAQAAPVDGAAAVAAYQSVLQDATVPAGWTGSVAGCVVGTESPASLTATLHTINTLRDFAGLGPVTLDPKLNQKALATALMMKAKGELSHTPDKDWPCYSKDGDEGARKSNLFLGRSGAHAMVGFIEDKNIPTLGHRRWLLSPAAVSWGTGSTGTTNALYHQGATKAVAPGTVVTWPPRGFVVAPWIFEDWSAALGASREKVDVSGATVRVTIDGQPVGVSGVSGTDPGYGFGATLKWRVALPPGMALDTGAHKIDIAIDGATIDGKVFPVAYSTQSVDPASPQFAVPRFAARPVVRPAKGRNRSLRAGMKVRVVVTVTNAQKVSYRWRRGRTPIRGAAGRTYVIKRADRGRSLNVQVTARSATGAQVVRTSASRRVARR